MEQENKKLRALAHCFYQFVGAVSEHLDDAQFEKWADTCLAAGEGEPFTTDGLLPVVLKGQGA
jgi:hypothetical protein